MITRVGASFDAQFRCNIHNIHALLQTIIMTIVYNYIGPLLTEINKNTNVKNKL